MATSIAAAHAGTGDPRDVSRPELYSENRWQEPFRDLRANAPIHFVENSRFGSYWSISTYKPIVHVEALPALYSSRWDYGGIAIQVDRDSPREGEIRLPMFIAMDPPQHTGQRRTVAQAFGPGEVAAMRAEVVARTAEVLDGLPLGTTFDWVERVSIELTTGMLAKLFDFPWDERHNLTNWSNIVSDVELFHTLEDRQKQLQGAMEMGAAFQRLWEEKAANPGGNDLISIMLRSDAMSHMEPHEFAGNMVLLVVGGNDTTRNSMTAYAYGLSQFPEERAKLEASPGLIPNAVSEIIRWQTPLAHMRRTAVGDSDLFGHQIKDGEKLILWYLSANRDESIFPDGDRIIVDRENARRHLSFGYGIHRCVGARVAELQLQVLLEEMAKRRLRVNPVAEPARIPACFVHGYSRLLVELERY